MIWLIVYILRTLIIDTFLLEKWEARQWQTPDSPPGWSSPSPRPSECCRCHWCAPNEPLPPSTPPISKVRNPGHRSWHLYYPERNVPMLWAAGSLITCAGPTDGTLSWLVSWLVSWSLKEEDSALSREAIKCWSERRQRLEGILLLVVATCGAGWRPAELSSPCRSCSGSARRPNTSQSQPGKQRRYSVFCVLRGRHVNHVWRDLGKHNMQISSLLWPSDCRKFYHTYVSYSARI